METVLHELSLSVNGEPRTLSVPSHHTLLRVLRDDFDLTGTKECCTEGECGACTVLLDGKAVDSCLMLAVEADGAELTTIEGLADDERLDPLQRAFVERGAVQCGFCIPGMIMTAKSLLADDPHPSRADVVEAVAGNLCRCGGYSFIVEAILAAAEAER
jgi:aerobic-type carbon monoxide dehydrogenase small subunit (CoxS/CutS family)